jgi:hypothetical protein
MLEYYDKASSRIVHRLSMDLFKYLPLNLCFLFKHFSLYVHVQLQKLCRDTTSEHPQLQV